MDFQSAADRLMKWYIPQRSEHFFRQHRTAYSTWVSEVALQQTRIEAALPVLKKFLQRFPTVQDLASAQLEEVKEAWAGLGYYRRATNLHKGAQQIVTEYQGDLPASLDQLKKITSIGPYTAAAIASIVYGLPEAVVDGNTQRIAARLQAIAETPGSKSLVEKSTALVQGCIDHSSLPPGDINEAFMELGQKICRVSTPLCTQCPLANNCQAYQTGDTSSYPKKKKKTQEELELHALAILRKGEIYLEKPHDSLFLKEQWGLPYMVKKLDSGHQVYASATSKKNISTSKTITLDKPAFITRYRLQLSLSICQETRNSGFNDLEAGQFYSMPEASKLCISSLHKRLLAAVKLEISQPSLFKSGPEKKIQCETN